MPTRKPSMTTSTTAESKAPRRPARRRAPPATVQASADAFLTAVALARSANTARTYRNGLKAFLRALRAEGIDPRSHPLARVEEDWILPFADWLKDLSPATERLYLSAVTGWYEYLSAERLASVNLPRVRLLIRQRSRRPGPRLPQFPRTAIDSVIEYATKLTGGTAGTKAHLRVLRDRAFLVTLADTGLRVHEACRLRRGDVDWAEGRATMVGKGDREAVVRFSRRSLRALQDYLKARSAVDGASGKPLSALPLFARHDRGAGKKVLPLTTTTGRAIVHQRCREALGDEASGITPHSFRHYFVTIVLRASGGNLKLAQELARHRSISVTQRYAHLSDDELDRGYHEIFEAERP